MKKKIIFIGIFIISFFNACKEIQISKVINLPNEIPQLYDEEQSDVIDQIRFDYFTSFIDDFLQSEMTKLLSSDTTLFIVEYYDRTPLPIECYEYNLLKTDTTFIITYCNPYQFTNVKKVNNYFNANFIRSIVENDYSIINTKLETAIEKDENLSPYYDLYCYKVFFGNENIQIDVLKMFRVKYVYEK